MDILFPFTTDSGIGACNGIQLAGVPESAGAARRFVRDILGEDHPVLAEATLLTSELVSNSIVHSRSRDGGAILLLIAHIVHRSPAIRLTVIDDGSPSEPTLLTEDDLSEHGRGLFLVATYATRWGHAHGRDMTVTWCEIEDGTRG